ncbi:MAG: hypothetical protein ACRENA_16970 [Vulcanimicrobiaceae bacterium]
MIVKLVLVPSLLLMAGLALLAVAMLASPAQDCVTVPPSERIRGLERAARGWAGVIALRRALRDPDPEVAAVAAILLGDVSARAKTWFPWRR